MGESEGLCLLISLRLQEGSNHYLLMGNVFVCIRVRGEQSCERDESFSRRALPPVLRSWLDVRHCLFLTLRPGGVIVWLIDSSIDEGVQKERMVPEDMYVLSSDGTVLSSPPPSGRTLISPSSAFEMHDAGAVIHSHGIESCLITMINPSLKEFRVMAHQKTTAVLVRNHGVYIWGKSWVSAKTQAESYHYLFDATFKLHQLGLGWSTPKHSRFTEALFVDHDMLEYSRHFLLLHLEGITFDDLPEALRKWHASGSKVYTYSSCRREAHRAIMGKYNSYGDLTKYFCGYYVAASSSYSEILLTVGVDKPSDMLFVTNSLLEAADARAADYMGRL
ncbi:hypothetical protein CRG98_017749 [Punica granatum]|uniref:Class II aldolase/adducin N-terminal domain-containing protein n=1 Tax=Punica granatum TaxID=22663 RepID=A0A2I0JZV2_PUNGR|nr:hypothetical protein CRG98_017749 [Punica granatum]